MSSTRFRDRIVRAQNEMLREQDFIAEAASGLSFQPGAHAQSKRLPLMAVAAALVAVAAGLVFFLSEKVPSNSALTAVVGGRETLTGEWIYGSLKGENLRFSDGSDIALSEDASLRIQRLTGNGAHLALEHGGLVARIVHRPETDWQIGIGPFTIDVTGTEFGVDWSSEQRTFKLDLRKGSVTVKGPMLGKGRTMTAGETMNAAMSEERIEIEDANHIKTIIFNGRELHASGEKSTDTSFSEDNDESVVERTDRPAREVLKDRPSPELSPSKWLALAGAGKYIEALETAKRAGVPYMLKTESATNLITLGDTARRAGDVETAAQAYKSVRRRFSDSAQAAGAAFALGLIAFDQKEDYRQAAKWFSTCMRSDKAGTFVREAAGRLMESLDREGDALGAEKAAREYLSRFPGGPHRRFAEKLLGEN